MKNIDIILSNKCNLDCLFCDSYKSNFYYGNTKSILFIITKFYKSGFKSITFSGGEPTLDNNLFIYILFAKKLGFSNIKIQTNLIFSTKYLIKLINKGVTSIGTTFFGLNKYTFKSITGNLNNFNIYYKNLNILSTYNIDISIDFVLNEYLVEHLGKNTDILLKLGFNNINYKFPFPIGKKKLDYDIIMYSNKLKKYLTGKEFNFYILYIPTCYLEGLENHIYDFKNDYIYDFKYLFSLKNSLKNISFKNELCYKCKYINSCYGYLR